MLQRSQTTLLVILLALTGQIAYATNSDQELDRVLADILAWLPGEYSTEAQRDMERRLGMPPDGEHEKRFRLFAVVDAPHIGANVIYGQLHAGDRDGPIIPGTQILYILEKDPAKQVVKANGRRIARGEEFVDAHLHADMQSRFELDPNTGGNCDFRWRRHGTQVVGILANIDEPYADGTCTMVSKVSDMQMTWDAEWVLHPEALWIYDNGYLEDGTLFIGREDRTHERLKKVHWFDCAVDTGDQPETYRIHDGGGMATLSDGRTLTLLRSWWPDENGTLGERIALAIDGSGDEPGQERFFHAGSTAFKNDVGGTMISCRRSP